MAKAVLPDAPTVITAISGCLGKFPYPNEGEARRAAAKAAKRDPGRANNRPYHCGQCGNWHIGRRRNGPIEKKGKWT